MVHRIPQPHRIKDIRFFHGTPAQPFWTSVLGLTAVAVVGRHYVLRTQHRLDQQREARATDVRQVLGLDIGLSGMSLGIVDHRSRTSIRVVENRAGCRRTSTALSMNRDGVLTVGIPTQSHENVARATQALLGMAKDTEDSLENLFHRLSGPPKRVCPTTQTWLLEFETEEEEYSPAYLMEVLLENLLEQASQYLEAPAHRASVLALPGHFDSHQMQQARRSCLSVGLDPLRIVHEPVAAIVAAQVAGAIPKALESPRILVFDMGGYCTSISIVEKKKEEWQLCAPSKVFYSCSGSGIDDLMTRRLSRAFERDHGIPIASDPLAMTRVTEAAVKAKHELSFRTSTEIHLPFLSADQNGPKHMLECLTRSYLEPFVDQELTPVLNYCREHCPLDEIDGIIFIGGSARSPLVVEKVCRELHLRSFQSSTFIPEEAIVMGACEMGKTFYRLNIESDE